jgi:hypothetical protein
MIAENLCTAPHQPPSSFWENVEGARSTRRILASWGALKIGIIMDVSGFPATSRIAPISFPPSFVSLSVCFAESLAQFSEDFEVAQRLSNGSLLRVGGVVKAQKNGRRAEC